MIKALLLLASALFFWSSCGTLLFGQGTRIPPDVLMIIDLNCVIHQQGKLYHATCTASYLNHDNYHREPWVIELPQEKTEKASYNDTVKWRREVLKIQAAARPVSVNQLKKEKQ